MTLAVGSTRAEFEAIVGPSGLISDRPTCEAFAIDGMAPEFTLMPSTTDKVAALLTFANERGLAVIPTGGGTKLSTGNPPRRYDAAISFGKLNRVIHYEPADLTITVEAGMKLGELQVLTGRDGLWLPLDPRGGAQSTVGGIIAANAAGPLRQAYGGPRDMLLGLKIATTEGKIAKTGGRVVKNVAGYDLCKLLTGSFGTLGVIVEASLKLFTKPPGSETFAFQAGTLESTHDLRSRIRRSPLDPLRMALIDPSGAALLREGTREEDQSGPELWIEVGGSARVIKRCEEELNKLASATGMPLNLLQNPESSWCCISDLALWLQSKYPDVTIFKAALPSEASEEFLMRAERAADAEQIPLAGFAQPGLGIVHTSLLQVKYTQSTAGLAMRLRQAATELGGTLIIEHCPVGLKRQIDVWDPGGDDLEVMRKMKGTWDPNGILSPGRFVGGI